MESLLLEGEEVQFQERALYKNKDAIFCVTDSRILVLTESYEVKYELSLANFEKIKYNNITEVDENSVPKLRVIDLDGNYADVKFKGPDCIKVRDRAVGRVKKMQKKYKSEHVEQEEPASDGEQAETEAGPPEPEHEFDPRDAFVGSNKVVLNMVKDLAERGLIDTQESTFWDNFPFQFAKVSIDPLRQQMGYSGCLLTEIQAQTDKKANQLTYNMSRAVRQQICRERPQVGKKYRDFRRRHKNTDYVDGISPEDENEFWKQYQTWITNRQNGSKVKDDDNIFKDGKYDDLVQFNPESRHLRYCGLVCDVTPGQLFDMSLGSGVMKEDWIPSKIQYVSSQKFGLESDRVIDKINIHSEITLIETKILPDSSAPLTEIFVSPPLHPVPRLEDLQEETSPPVKPLVLTSMDPTADPAPKTHSASMLAGASAAFADTIGSYALNFTDVQQPPRLGFDEARNVLIDMMNDDSSLYDYHTLQHAPARLLEALDHMRCIKLEQQMLLANYWVSAGSKKYQERAAGLRARLEEFMAEKNSERSAIYDGEILALVSPLYDEMFYVHSMLDPSARRDAKDDFFPDLF